MKLNDRACISVNEKTEGKKLLQLLRKMTKCENNFCWERSRIGREDPLDDEKYEKLEQQGIIFMKRAT